VVGNRIIDSDCCLDHHFEIAMSHPVKAPKPPKGLAFDLSDHDLASVWAKRQGLYLMVDICHQSEGDEFEEVLVYHRGGRVFWLIWRQTDGIVVQTASGLKNRYYSLNKALEHLTAAPTGTATP
jgi:hypothetical protein